MSIHDVTNFIIRNINAIQVPYIQLLPDHLQKIEKAH